MQNGQVVEVAKEAEAEGDETAGPRRALLASARRRRACGSHSNDACMPAAAPALGPGVRSESSRALPAMQQGTPEPIRVTVSGVAKTHLGAITPVCMVETPMWLVGENGNLQHFPSGTAITSSLPATASIVRIPWKKVIKVTVSALRCAALPCPAWPPVPRLRCRCPSALCRLACCELCLTACSYCSHSSSPCCSLLLSLSPR